MIMVLGPHKKKTEAMAEAREAQAARKAERQGHAPDDHVDESPDAVKARADADAEAPAESSTEA